MRMNQGGPKRRRKIRNRRVHRTVKEGIKNIGHTSKVS
jgi:hypothetical protein